MPWSSIKLGSGGSHRHRHPLFSSSIRESPRFPRADCPQHSPEAGLEPRIASCSWQRPDQYASPRYFISIVPLERKHSPGWRCIILQSLFLSLPRVSFPESGYRRCPTNSRPPSSVHSIDTHNDSHSLSDRLHEHWPHYFPASNCSSSSFLAMTLISMISASPLYCSTTVSRQLGHLSGHPPITTHQSPVCG